MSSFWCKLGIHSNIYMGINTYCNFDWGKYGKEYFILKFMQCKHCGKRSTSNNLPRYFIRKEKHNGMEIYSHKWIYENIMIDDNYRRNHILNPISDKPIFTVIDGDKS